MIPFQQICPKLAMDEQRSIRLEGSSDETDLPSDEYGLIESYCQEQDCDCRRVILTVVSKHRNKVEATISFGFDPAGDMPGPFLDPLNRQGKYADEVLDLVASLLRRDRDYVARLKRHYQIAKDIQNGRLRPEDAAPSFRLPTPQPVDLIDPISGSDRTPRRGTVQPDDAFDIHQNLGDEYDEERVEEYIEGMTRQFALSPEGRALVEQDVSLAWAATLVRYSLMYFGRQPQVMSPADHDEVLFTLIPRKVSTSPESAEEIVTELRTFWKFLDRHYGFFNAAPIRRSLDRAAVKRLQDELANPENFGMAKSFFRMGELAGFGMSTPEGLAAFTLQYNSQQAAKPGEQNRRDRSPGSGPQGPTSHGGRRPIVDFGFPFDIGMRTDSGSKQERQPVRDARKRQRQAKKRNRR